MMDQAPVVESSSPPPSSPRAPDLSASKHNPTAKPPATPAPDGPPKPPPPPPKGPPRSFASVAASPAPEGWKVVQRKPSTKANKNSPSAPVAAMDDRTFEFPHNTGFKLKPNETENITSRINRALHGAGISNTRVERVRCTETHRILGVTSPTSTLKDLLQHRDMVLRAARTDDASISDITA